LKSWPEAVIQSQAEAQNHGCQGKNHGVGLVNNPTPKGAAICISASLKREKYSRRQTIF
jgi:hypothetical protein